jgi:hypothetical protein
MLPDADAPGAGLRLRIVDAWTRRCLDGPPALSAEAPAGRAAAG